MQRLRMSPAPLRPRELVPDAVAEITNSDFPVKRLIVCLNSRLPEERTCKREDLLPPIEASLAEVPRIVCQPRSRLRGRDDIDRRVHREANRRKAEKHFRVFVEEDNLCGVRDTAKIGTEARPDGICIIRTSLGRKELSAHEAVHACEAPSRIEGAFRSVKTAQLKVRSVFVYTADQGAHFVWSISDSVVAGSQAFRVGWSSVDLDRLALQLLDLRGFRPVACGNEGSAHHKMW